MEDKLVSEWEKHVISGPDKILPVNTFIQSCHIKERALSILLENNEKNTLHSID